MKKHIQAYRTRALHWWNQRETREQRLLAGLSLVLIIAFFWFVVWQPLQQGIEQTERSVAVQQETLRWVSENTQRVKQLREQDTPQVNALSSNQLTQYINQVSSELELEISRIQPQGEALLIVFNEADFDDFLEFLAALAERQVQIDVMDLAETDEAGVVRVRRLQVRAG
ncbi:type II secretion system protein M [Aliidiomarina minuta]|uniref:Type II secretion system protein M n=1 Tax=Aliidiomarina minuta TaxID=880057 RepID=A0A432W8H1_9GAMM|nr:type II secretion system protein M [Aliidiomarina minuta]RUO26427.1 type II secretion system protein M [Aliidiomarina minuta]